MIFRALILALFLGVPVIATAAPEVDELSRIEAGFNLDPLRIQPVGGPPAQLPQSAQPAQQAPPQAGLQARQAARISQDGGAAVRAAVDKMGALAQAAGRIRDVVGVIDSIAFQTNILALNAAVDFALQ